MDISIEAIEAELAQAQANAGRPVATEALMRAQILATLYAAQPPLRTVVDMTNASPESFQPGPIMIGRDVSFATVGPEESAKLAEVDERYHVDLFDDDDEDEDDGLSRLGPNR
jgi:hypothetical protein